MAIADKLTYLNETKTRLRRAINNAGGGVSLETPFRSYVGEILRDQSTLLLDFETGVYGSGESATKRNDSQEFSDLISFSRSTTAGFFNQFGLYETAAINQPRIDHDPATLRTSTDTLTIGLGIKVINTNYEYTVGDVVVVSYDATNYMVGKVLASSASEVTLNVIRVVGSGTYSTWSLIVRKGMLVEESRTNLLAYSEFQDGATLGGGLVTQGTFSFDVLGAVTGVAFGYDAATTSYARRQHALTVGVTYVFSAFVEMDDGFPPVVANASTGAGIDLTLIIANSFGTLLTVEHVGGKLYRVSTVHTATTTNNSHGVYKYAGFSNRTFKVTGYQLEAGTFPTSYIPTAGAAVTRAAEEGYSLDTGWYNPDGGTVLLEYDFTDGQTAATNRFFPARLGTSSATSGTTLGLYASDRLITRTPGPTTVDPVGGVAGAAGTQLTDPAKIAFIYDADGLVTGCKNGAAPRAVVDIGCDMSVTTLMAIATSAQYSGHIKSIRYVPRRLTDEELSIITS